MEMWRVDERTQRALEDIVGKAMDMAAADEVSSALYGYTQDQISTTAGGIVAQAVAIRVGDMGGRPLLALTVAIGAALRNLPASDRKAASEQIVKVMLDIADAKPAGAVLQ